MIESQRAFAVGKTSEGDEPDKIVRAAGQSAALAWKLSTEFPNDVLHRRQPADVAPRQLKIERVHRTRNVEHDFDGDPFAGDARFRLPRLRPRQAGNHEAEPRRENVGKFASQPLCQSNREILEIPHARKDGRRPLPAAKAPHENRCRQRGDNQPIRGIEATGIHEATMYLP